MTAAAVRRSGHGSGARSRRTAPQEPVKRHGSCAVCGGAITYYPRRSDDIAPRTSIDDSARWAHNDLSDWIGRPHRARPQVGPGEDGPLPASPVAGARICVGGNEERGVR